MKIAINGEILEVSGGGALPEGTVAVKPITQAEYEALTDAEKQADVVYAITDDAGEPSSKVYSTEEKAVGVWVDGKTVYEMSAIGTFPATANENNEAILTLITFPASMRIDMVVNFSANVSTNDGWIPVGSGDPTRNIVARIAGNSVTIASYSVASTPYVLGRRASVTVRYTKTTDTGGTT